MKQGTQGRGLEGDAHRQAAIGGPAENAGHKQAARDADADGEDGETVEEEEEGGKRDDVVLVVSIGREQRADCVVLRAVGVFGQMKAPVGLRLIRGLPPGGRVVAHLGAKGFGCPARRDHLESKVLTPNSMIGN
eukprot:3478511-Pyramimonas_sp.AAC.2